MNYAIITLLLFLTLFKVAIAQELSEANIRKLSTLSDSELVGAYVLTDYKLEALRRRDEHRRGVVPRDMRLISTKKIMELGELSIRLDSYYKMARKLAKESLPALSKACEASYGVKQKLKGVVSRSTNLLLHFFSNDQDSLLRAQTWLLLGLLKNYYTSSITAYATGEIYSPAMGASARCFSDAKLRGELARGESELLNSINWALTNVVGQPGVQRGPWNSEIIAQEYVRYQSVPAQLTRILDRTMIEVVSFYAGYSIVRHATTSIFWAPKAYTVFYSTIQGYLAQPSAEQTPAIESKNYPARHMLAFGDRLMLFSKSGFDIQTFELEKQMQFASELERIYRQETLTIAAEAKKLCQGQCAKEQASALAEKFARNKKEILAVLKTR